MVDFTEVLLAVVATALVICVPILMVRSFDQFARRQSAPQVQRPVRERYQVAADLLRLRAALSDERITVGDRRRAVAEYDRVLAEASSLLDIEHVLDAKNASHLDRELERFRVEAAVQSAGWTIAEPRRRDQDA